MDPFIIPVDKQNPVLPTGMCHAMKISTQGTDQTHHVEAPLQRASRLWVKSDKLKVWE